MLRADHWLKVRQFAIVHFLRGPFGLRLGSSTRVWVPERERDGECVTEIGMSMGGLGRHSALSPV